MDRPYTTCVSSADLSRSLSGKPVSQIADALRRRRALSLLPGLADPSATAKAVSSIAPDSAADIIAEAEALLTHRVRVFGTVCDLGPEIDWLCDPELGVSWPRCHFTRVPVILPGRAREEQSEPARGADIRVVWELNRLHHFVTLGQAYALTGDERFTIGFLRQLSGWRDQNPPRFGPNWKVAMEAAIRAVNVIAAIGLFRDSPSVTDDDFELLLKFLLDHGRYIQSNLERRRGGSSNHYLADLIGLFTIGTAFPWFKESSGWMISSSRALLREMEEQVLPDGVDYEGSIAYHRLVTEIFALYFTLGSETGEPLQERHWSRLDSMFDFVRHYIKPEGGAPALGDSDDGRLLSFGRRAPGDHSYLLSIAAVLFGDDKYRTDERIDPEAVWWFGPAGVGRFNGMPLSARPGSQGFPNAGIFIQRSPNPETGLFAIIDCGDNGARGHGSHAHCDALSIELSAYGQTFLVDPGTYGYTGAGRWRNWFRSTAVHNTARIDGREISPLIEGWNFALG
jgi:hypothetical protein